MWKFAAGVNAGWGSFTLLQILALVVLEEFHLAEALFGLSF